MATITFHDKHGEPLKRFEAGAATKAALAQLDIASGTWALQPQPVSATPHLTYVRELQALQRRFGTVLTDHVQLPQLPMGRPGRNVHGPRAAWPEPDDEHLHSDPELRVLLRGSVRYVLRAGVPAGWATVVCEPGDWLGLPAAMPHRFEPRPGEAVEVMRLFTRRAGGVAERTPRALPSRLARWDRGHEAHDVISEYAWSKWSRALRGAAR